MKRAISTPGSAVQSTSLSGDHIQSLFRRKMESVKNLESAEKGIVMGLVRLRETVREKSDRIGFVCGVLTSDGPEFLDANLARHRNYTSSLREAFLFPVFSATDVFDDKLLERLKDEPESSWRRMWRGVLSTQMVTDLFFTPGWERSIGAKDEHDTAKNLGLKIHYLNEDHSHNLLIVKK